VSPHVIPYRRSGRYSVLPSGISLLVAMVLPLSQGLANELAAYQSLLDNSPFLTPAFKAQLARRDRTAIIFLGYTRIGGTLHFALYDGKLAKSYWLTLNAEEDNIRIEKFNEKKERLHVTVDGISAELSL